MIPQCENEGAEESAANLLNGEPVNLIENIQI